MSPQSRRRILKHAGIAATTGGLFTATGTAVNDDGDADDDETGFESVIGPDGWSSLGGGPGNNSYRPETDGPEEPAVDWTYEHGGSIAVVDDGIFLTTGGAVHALSTVDGSLEWDTRDIGARGAPAVTSDGVYVGGDRLTKITPQDGDICCYVELDYDESVPSPVVVDDLVFVVADGTLSAVDADEMAVEWEFEPDEDSLYEQPVAVADGAVVVVSESRVFALELEDGTERWVADDPPGSAESYFANSNPRHTRYPIATDDVVAVGTINPQEESMWQEGQIALLDIETGEERVTGETPPAKPGPITDDRFYGIDSHGVQAYDNETGEEVWDPAVSTYIVRSVVAGDETVYAGLRIDGEAYGPDERPEPETGVYAFGDEDGDVDWEIDTDGVPTLALVDDTLYASSDDELVAIRAESDSEDGADEEEDGTDEEEDGTDEDEDADDESDDGDEPVDATGDDEEADADDSLESADSESDGATNESDSGGTENESGTGSDGNESDTGYNGNESGGDGNESDAGSDNESESDDGSDETPGFTAGAGIAGGAVTLEWLRRRTGTDETASE